MLKFSSLSSLLLLLSGCAVTRITQYNFKDSPQPKYEVGGSSNANQGKTEVSFSTSVAKETSAAGVVVASQPGSLSQRPSESPKLENQRTILEIPAPDQQLGTQLAEQNSFLTKLMLQVDAEQKSILTKLGLQMEGFKSLFTDVSEAGKADTRGMFDALGKKLETISELAVRNIKFWEVGGKLGNAGVATKPSPYTWLMPGIVLLGYLASTTIMIVVIWKLLSKLSSLKSAEAPPQTQ